MTRRMQWLAVAVLAVVAVLPPLVTTDVQLGKLSSFTALVLAVLGVNLLTGYTGLISLGHGVFVGIGAFAVANFIDLGLPIPVAVIAATLVTGLIGVLLGLPALRVRGLHLALISFGFALAFGPVARKFRTLTGGSAGRTVDNDGFAPPSFLGVDGQVELWRYWTVLLVVIAWFVVVRKLIDSRVGRAMRTVRDNELAAAAFGINVARTKAGVLATSAAMTGCAGAMQALVSPFIGEEEFDAFLSLRLYAAAVVGGLGTLLGALIGTLALIVVPVVNTAVGLIKNEDVVFGAGLIIISLIAPQGLAGLLTRQPHQGHSSRPQHQRRRARRKASAS